MATPNVFFKKGLLANLPASHKEGTIYVTTDERAMYLDINDSERIRLGDFIEYATWADIQALDSAKISTTALYYAAQENVLCKYTGSSWKQINPDTIVKNTEVLMTATAVADGATVTTKVTDSKGSLDSSINIKGSGATTVSVVDGEIIISSTDENDDTKVTSVENHYVPEENADSKLSATSGFITGIKRDAAGHVTGIETSEQALNGVTAVTMATSGDANSATITTTVSQSIGEAKSGKVTFKGAGGATVSQDDSVDPDTITITTTDRSVTSAEHHYTPVADAASAVEIAAGKVISGITRDAKGHIVEVTTRDDNNLDAVALATSDVEAGAAVKTTVTMKDGTSKNASFSIVGDGSQANGVITISSVDEDSKVTSVDNHYKATGASAGTHSATGEGDVIFVSGVTTDAAGHVTGITSGTYTDKDTHANISAVGASLDGSSLKITVTDTDNKSATGSVALPTVTLGTNAPIVVADGTYTLPVYTKDETDNKITEAIGASNAMVLKGGLGGSDGLSALPAADVQQGDTYIVLAAGTYGGVTAEVGDTFVAKADAAASTDANWYYVPAGDDIATIAGIEGGFALTQGSEGTTTGQVVFAANADGNMVPTVTTTTVGSYQQVQVSYDMVWGEF